ncbi:hypothetical protein J6T66_04200, partial [bacterium]|nr:hypothetical protein [bacterium]
IFYSLNNALTIRILKWKVFTSSKLSLSQNSFSNISTCHVIISRNIITFQIFHSDLNWNNWLNICL